MSSVIQWVSFCRKFYFSQLTGRLLCVDPIVRALMDMAKLKDYRKEILNAGGLQTLKESVVESGYVVQETSRKLKKLLVSRSTRFRMALDTARTQAHGTSPPCALA